LKFVGQKRKIKFCCPV